MALDVSALPTLAAFPVLFRDKSLLGPPPFAATPTYPLAGEITNSVNVYDPNIKVPYSQSWTIGVQRELDKDTVFEARYLGARNLRECLMLQLENQAVATSGTYRQFFSYRGRRYHHLMDPMTASPRETQMRSLTIVADRVMHADAATTALFGLSENDITRELERNLPGARLVKIPECGHMSAMEQPAAVNAALAAWLDE